MTKLEKDYALVVAENLRRLIYEKKVEQKDIAKVAGVSPASVSLWLSGQRTPRMKHIDALCKFLGCTRADIMEPSWKKREQKEISDEQADLIRLTMTASSDNVSLVLAMLKKLEGIT